MASSASLAAPLGARCADHPAVEAVGTCPYCGSFACVACWRPGTSTCFRCVGRVAVGPVVPLEVGPVMKASWDAYRRAAWPLIFPMVFQMLAILPFYAVQLYGAFAPDPTLVNIGTAALYVFSFVMSPPFQTGTAIVALAAVRSQPVTAGMFFGGFRHWPKAFVAYLILFVPFVVVAVGAGAVGFVLQRDPALLAVVIVAVLAVLVVSTVLFLGTFLWPFYMVDRKTGPIESLGASWRATRGRRLTLLLLWIVLVIVNLGGACACGIPMIVLTVPLTTAAMALMYTTCAAPAEVSRNAR